MQCMASRGIFFSRKFLGLVMTLQHHHWKFLCGHAGLWTHIAQWKSRNWAPWCLWILCILILCANIFLIPRPSGNWEIKKIVPEDEVGKRYLTSSFIVESLKKWQWFNIIALKKGFDQSLHPHTRWHCSPWNSLLIFLGIPTSLIFDCSRKVQVGDRGLRTWISKEIACSNSSG